MNALKTGSISSHGSEVSFSPELRYYLNILGGKSPILDSPNTEFRLTIPVMVSFVPRPSWGLKKNIFNDPSFRSLFLTGKSPIYRINVNSYPVISPFSIPVVGEKPPSVVDLSGAPGQRDPRRKSPRPH